MICSDQNQNERDCFSAAKTPKYQNKLAGLWALFNYFAG